MEEIQSRHHIFQLVTAFYGKVRVDELLGPIFNRVIPEEEWPDHLEKLTSFWETNLLGKMAYKGNPSQAHVKVDQVHGNKISQLHFHQWLMLWFETIDSMYEGILAERAKDGARRMSTGQFLAMVRHRK